MSLVQLTGPDGSEVAINQDEIVHLARVPTSGPLMGPLTEDYRVARHFRPNVPAQSEPGCQLNRKHKVFNSRKLSIQQSWRRPQLLSRG